MEHTCMVDLHAEGLQDGCPRCAELAARPLDVDSEMLRDLVRLAVRRDRITVGRSEAELVASAGVLTLLEQLGRLAELAPDEVAAYLVDRWHLNAEIENPRAVTA